MKYTLTRTAINGAKLIRELNLSSFVTKINGVTIVGDDIELNTISSLSQTEEDSFKAIVAQHDNNDMTKFIEDIVESAIDFGQNLMRSFVTENVMMGITQAGKTGVVADYLNKLSYYISIGSLYEAINEVDRLVSGGVPTELSPFVTSVRLNAYKAKIQAYLA